jgi:hypothetical protein
MNQQTNQISTFNCVVKKGAEELPAEGVVLKQEDTFDVQVFLNSQFYTFSIIRQQDHQYMLRLVRIHDRTGTLISLKTLLLTDPKVEMLFERVLTTLVNQE